MARIEDYALIGDLQTAALVSRNGSIDWCCFPRFDSGACFAALLGNADNGRGLLAPATRVRRHARRYRTDTLILESTFETNEGSVRAIDFMPPRGEAPDIVRIVEGLDGSVPMLSELVIRFDFGHIVPWVRRVDHARVATAGPDALCYRAPVDVRGEDLKTVSEFTLHQGDRIAFTLTWFPSHRELPEATDPEQALDETEAYWLDWAGRCTHVGDYHDEIHQSLLVLKALTYAPTGGIVAAPTTSLPEWIGSVRNWDYRFCWLRDAILTLLAMLNAGWREQDAGIWEVRGPPRHFTYSKVLAWVAFDRAVRLCEEYGQDGAVAHWRARRAEVRAEVLARAWSEKKQAYAQSFGADELDASVLLMPTVGFLPATDERFVSTVEAIPRELVVDGLVLR